MRLFLFLVTVFCASVSSADSQQTQVSLELVLAVDTSTSVDEREFELQRMGIAEAFAHPDLLAIIQVIGQSGIAVTLIEWAGTNSQAKIVDWTLLTSAASSLAFSQKVREAPRALSGMTDIGSVIDYSVSQLEGNRYSGARRVIDVSGDGSSSVDTARRARDRAINLGITINGLVIYDEKFNSANMAEVDLIRHYLNQVIGGNGSFLITANGFEDFRHAILKKLIKEILGTGLAEAKTSSPQ